MENVLGKVTNEEPKDKDDPKRKMDLWNKVEFSMLLIICNERKNINVIKSSRIHCPERHTLSREEK